MTTLLIIEDDAQTRENLEIILDMEGFSVRSAANGREGIALAQAHHPDLVICDVSMPQLDGHEVLRQLRADAQTAAIPFIFLTARGEKQPTIIFASRSMPRTCWPRCARGCSAATTTMMTAWRPRGRISVLPARSNRWA